MGFVSGLLGGQLPLFSLQVLLHLCHYLVVVRRRTDDIGECLYRHAHFLQEALVSPSRKDVFADATGLDGPHHRINFAQVGHSGGDNYGLAFARNPGYQREVDYFS